MSPIQTVIMLSNQTFADGPTLWPLHLAIHPTEPHVDPFTLILIQALLACLVTGIFASYDVYRERLRVTEYLAGLRATPVCSFVERLLLYCLSVASGCAVAPSRWYLNEVDVHLVPASQ